MNPDSAPRPKDRPPPLPHRPGHPDLGLTCLPEIGLSLADHGLIGTVRWRLLAYQYGAFWAGLLQGWQPNYAAQPVLMFVSHALLHTGPVHLIGNMLGLAWLGARITARWGQAGLLWVYGVALLGGAAGFGLLSQNPAPMLGASGAVFGLAAAWILAGWRDRQQSGQPGWAALRPALGLTFVLALFNLIIWVLENGQLAWETHLGGFLAGACAAAVLERWHRPARPDRKTADTHGPARTGQAGSETCGLTPGPPGSPGTTTAATVVPCRAAWPALAKIRS